MDNPETLSILGKQNTGRRQEREIKHRREVRERQNTGRRQERETKHRMEVRERERQDGGKRDKTQDGGKRERQIIGRR
jgi:hypothetical protein